MTQNPIDWDAVAAECCKRGEHNYYSCDGKTMTRHEKCKHCGVLRNDLRPQSGATLWAPR